MPSSKLAFAPIARPTFDLPLAKSITEFIREQLLARGYPLITSDELITDLDAVDRLAASFKDEQIDLLLVLQATFADSRMVVRLAEETGAPILLWAIPEAPAGGRLRLNSLCGINLGGHALTLRKRKYAYAYAGPEDESVYQTIASLAQAGRVQRLLRQTQIGLIGEHPDGMDTCHLDAKQLKERLGVRVKQIDLGTLFNRMDKIPEKTLKQTHDSLAERLPNLGELPEIPLRGTLRAYHSLLGIGDEEKIAGFAVRCWPEFFEQQGCAACGAMSLLNDQLIPSACEADVNGTLTQLILQWLSETPAFGADVVSIDVEQNHVIIWHCGKAPLSMADPETQAEGGLHSNRQMPLVMEFPLKSGRITAARLSQATGTLRLVIAGGEMLPRSKKFYRDFGGYSV